MVVFMGKDWPGALANGTRRIDQDDDVFRQEIEAALKTSMAVIPVLLGDVQQPLEAELPSPLMKLASLQAHRICPERKDEGITRTGSLQMAAGRREQIRRLWLLATGLIGTRSSFPPS